MYLDSTIMISRFINGGWILNLYENTRGINRFLGLYLLFNEMQQRGDIQAGDLLSYQEYITQHQTHHVESLKRWYDQSKDSFIEKVLKWSENVNQKIDQEMPTIDLLMVFWYF